MEKIQVQKFVEELNKKHDMEKYSFQKSIITSTSLPLNVKQIAIQALIDKSISVSDLGVSFIDEFVLKINMVLSIVGIYTCLDVNSGNAYDIYDLLINNGIYKFVVNTIGDVEYNELIEVKECLIKNWKCCNSTVESFVMKALKGFDSILELIEDEQENTEQVVMTDDNGSNS